MSETNRLTVWLGVSAAPPCDRRASGAPRGVWEAGDGMGRGMGGGSASTMRCDVRTGLGLVGLKGGIEGWGWDIGVTRARG